jgi:hypothetical protein
VNSSDSIKGLAKALVQAQGNMTTLRPDSTNNHLNSRYASLSAVNDACLPALNKSGIAVIQGAFTTTDEHGNTWVNTQVSFIHGDSGEIWTETLAMRPAKSDPQGIGSTITYGRKYLLMAMSGLAPDDDDDGNTASQQRQQTAQQKPRAHEDNDARLAHVERTRELQRQQQQAPQPQHYPSPPVVKEDVSNGAAPAKTFSGPDEAQAWAVEQKVFSLLTDAKAAYEHLKGQKKPKSPDDMWAVWIELVEARKKEAA